MSKSTRRSLFQAFSGGMYWSLCIHLAIIFTLGCLVEGRPHTLKKCGKRYAPLRKIIGGEWAMPGEYPWMVSVHEQRADGLFVHICGGTILNEYYIVTAAHCIYFPDEPSKYEIFVGLHRQSTKFAAPAKRYKISKIIIHEGYDEDEFSNDIALLRTKEAIKFEGTAGYVNGICLPTTDADPKGWAIVTGWGHTVEGGVDSDVLRVVKVPLIPRDLCFKSYYEEEDAEILESQLCAGTSNRDSCQDDSGGPIIQKDERGTFTLIGIVSFGIGCGNRRYPGVYTKVAYFMDWLEENMVEFADAHKLTSDKLYNGTLSKLLFAVSHLSHIEFLSTH